MTPRLDLAIFLVSGLGMMLVAALAVIDWRRVPGATARWFWIGAGLWRIAVALKLMCALLSNAAIFAFLRRWPPYWLFVASGGLYLGSSPASSRWASRFWPA